MVLGPVLRLSCEAKDGLRRPWNPLSRHGFRGSAQATSAAALGGRFTVNGCRSQGARQARPARRHGRKWAGTSSPHSVGGPLAGDTGGGSIGSPTGARICLYAGEAILAFLHAGSSRRSASRRRSHPGLRPLANLRFEVCRLQPAVCFTQAKPSWPSSACEPPVRSVPAPAGGLLHAGEAILAFVRLRTSGSKCAGSSRRSAPLRNEPDVTAAGRGTQLGTPRRSARGARPAPRAWPTRCGRCRGSCRPQRRHRAARAAGTTG